MTYYLNETKRKFITKSHIGQDCPVPCLVGLMIRPENDVRFDLCSDLFV